MLLRYERVYLYTLKNISQEELARAVGVSVNTIARFEQGEIGDMKAQVLAKIAQTLGVSTDWLLDLTSDEADEERLVGARSS
jgi:transcriptional regulator with XRE-family HTH domain